MTHQNTSHKKSTGFTLIELMIAVAIVGILTSIAIPSYTSYIQKSKRTEAMVAVMQVAQLQEKFYSQNLRYADTEQTLYGLASGVAVESENDLYTIDVSGTKSGGTACDNTAANACITFTVTATAKSSESQYKDLTCREFSLTNTGAKSSKFYNGSTTVANSSGTCW